MSTYKGVEVINLCREIQFCERGAETQRLLESEFDCRMRAEGLNTELVETLKLLRADHSKIEPHHEDLCSICKAADSTLAKVQQPVVERDCLQTFHERLADEAGDWLLEHFNDSEAAIVLAKAITLHLKAMLP